MPPRCRHQAIVFAALCLSSLTARAESGFISLFDGRTLNGWKETHKTKGPPYYVTNGVIASPPNAANDLVTDRAFSDFILRLDFKLTPAANNGIGIRVPFETNDLTYSGNEVQVLDDTDSAYAHLDPGQYCGSLYKIFPAKRGAVKGPGEWNHYEITAIGRHIKVNLNGQTIVDGNLNDVTNRDILRGHPGMLRDSGHIALLGHWSHVEFKNIYIKELPHKEKDNVPPEGFTPLFNGRDLDGWKHGPYSKIPSESVEVEVTSLRDRPRPWHVEKHALTFDGNGLALLLTAHDYGDFEMLADWKIPAQGSGDIRLRGLPAVQIWATNSPGQSTPPTGSGALWNNRKGRHQPMLFADHPVGEWNRFRILIVGDRVHVFLNGQLVVRDTTLENYLAPDKPVPATGLIELDGAGSPLAFKNIYIREISP
jgi:Domain of Unknown Function (DUF1080)